MKRMNRNFQKLLCGLCMFGVFHCSVVRAQEVSVLSSEQRAALIKAILDALELPGNEPRAQARTRPSAQTAVTPVTRSKTSTSQTIQEPRSSQKIQKVQAMQMPDNYTPAPVPAPAPTPVAKVPVRNVPAEKTAGNKNIPKDLEAWQKSTTFLQRVKISGEIRTSMGIDDRGEATFNRANADLNERNFRLLSFNALDNGINTFDPATYSRVKVVFDAAIKSSLSAHLNITVDPWSFTGKTREELVFPTPFNSLDADGVKVKYLIAGNTGYTLGRIYYPMLDGGSFVLPELKVKHGKVPAHTGVVTADGFPPKNFNVPEMDVDYSFQPIREAWLDYKPAPNTTFRFFPMAYENQALSTDDPLKLSNNKTWWEDSPWITSWMQGQYHAGFGINNFTAGQWDRSLSFYTRDSDGTRLTALRGFSMDVNRGGETTLQATVASPKTLWQEYREVTAIPASVRIKHLFGDDAYIGTTTNAHLGYANGERDAENYVGSIDAAVIPVHGIKATGEYAFSESKMDETSETYRRQKEGSAYYASLEASTNPNEILQKDYWGLQPLDMQDNFLKSRLFFGKMDEDFESSLSSYHQTRKDAFWSRHLTFYPSTYRYMPGISAFTSDQGLESFAIGNGLDYGRSVFGLRGDIVLLDGKLKGMGDARNVSTTNGDHIETVERTKWDYQVTDKLTAKFLYVGDQLPETTQDFDPFVVDGNTGSPLQNYTQRGGEDPSLNTASLGARYALNNWAAVNGVWEYTNDSTLATDNFPQGVLNSLAFTGTYDYYGRTYTQQHLQVYSQGYFDQAPYNYFNIFKAGLELTPSEKWHIYLDFTRNPNQFAGNIDDNMNHYGIESSYNPNEHLGFFARYTYSKWYDINDLVLNNNLKYRGFHNVFLESRWLFDKNSWVSLQYGVGPAYNVASQSTDPQLAFYATPVLETQQLLRLTVEKKF